MSRFALIKRLKTCCLITAAFALGAQAVAGDFEDGQDAYERGDYPAAFDRYQAAAEAGHQDAQYRLAEMYHEGTGIERDESLAAYWYRKTAERGNSDAQYWLCIMHREGMGVPRDYGESFYWCLRASENGHAAALFAVGQFYFDGLGNGFTRNHVKAYIWYSLALEQGDEDAPLMLEVLERDMPPLQIESAQRQARHWVESGRAPCTSNNQRARAC